MKKITLVALLATFSLSVFAQGGEKGPFLTNRFQDNWFISVAGGVNVYVGEADGSADFGKRLAPALDVAVGKWITPAIGARLAYSGLQGKGAAPYASAPFVIGNENGVFTEKFNYTFVHADALWNASTTFGGYKETRFWEFIPFAGFGPAMAGTVEGPRNRILDFGFTAGLLNKIRLGNRVDLNLEARGMLIKQSFDGVSGGFKGEGMASVTAGLTVKLGKTNFEKGGEKVAPADYTPYNNRINALQSDLAAARARADQLANDLAAARNVRPQTTTEVIFPEMAIFFEIGKATLNEKEKINIANLSEAIKKMPAGKKVVLEGTADKETGTSAFNMSLSQKRVYAVYDALIAAGVSASQLEKAPKGDTVQPYGKPALNRVLIIQQ